MTLSLAMQADDAALIEKHQLESLRMVGEADAFAKKLLAADPDAADAYLTLGTANYVIGSLPALKRFFLHVKASTATSAAASSSSPSQRRAAGTSGPLRRSSWRWPALREKRPAVARIQLMEPVAEFPRNLLFGAELATLDAFSR